MPMRSWFCILMLLSLIPYSSLAEAGDSVSVDDASCSPATNVDEAVRQGIALREAKTIENNKKAYALFLCSYELTKNKQINQAKNSEALFQLYSVEMVLGMWLDARKHAHDALQRTDEYITTSVIHDRLLSDIELIKRYIGSLHVSAIDAKTGNPISHGTLSVNGNLLTQLPMAQPIDLIAGTVGLEIVSPGYYSDKPEVAILSNRLVRYAGKLVKIPIHKKWQFWVGLGVGSAVLATAIGLGTYYGVKDRPDRDIVLHF